MLFCSWLNFLISNLFGRNCSEHSETEPRVCCRAKYAVSPAWLRLWPLIAPNSSVTGEQLIEMNLEMSACGLIEVLFWYLQEGTEEHPEHPNSG
jgi:hypothetical protein